MDFLPPRCPNRACLHHLDPDGRFFRRHGSYQPRCRSQPVPRFRCRGCNKTFSRQTFRQDRGDRRPECNEPLFRLLISGVGLRQAGRQLRLDVKSVQHKHRKIGRHCELLHGNLSPELPEGRAWLLDEEETYEQASIRPVTMPVLIERETWFVVATAAGSIRRLAKPGTRRRQLQDEDERRHGRRPDESSACVRRVLEALCRKVVAGRIVLQTDEKSSYRTLAQAVFGDRLAHFTTPGRLARTTRNPLFPINTTMAMTRDNCGRLRRKSWLVTKNRLYLQIQMHLFLVYRNYVRRRFNRDKAHETPAFLLGLLPRQLLPDEALGWRQDWGGLSIHPMSPQGTAVVTRKLARGA